MLEVRGVDVVIEGKQILSDVDLRVADGEVVGLLGPSGSGKSTLLRAIAGLVEVSEGDIVWDGQSVIDVPTHQRGFGFMFQRYALFPHLDVAENVAFGLRMQGRTDTDKRVEAALEQVGLREFGSRRIDGLSGGEQQRVALARTLAPEPKLVMLDEPLGALDRNLRRRLLGEIARILDERAVTGIVVTHDREEAVALTDRLALMRDGTVVQTGTLDELLAHPVDDWVSSFLS